MTRRRFRTEDYTRTARLLLCRAHQQAILDPYVRNRTGAQEAIPVLEACVALTDGGRSYKRDELLVALGRISTHTPGGAEVLARLRNRIIGKTLVEPHEDTTRDIDAAEAVVSDLAHHDGGLTTFLTNALPVAREMLATARSAGLRTVDIENLLYMASSKGLLL